MRAAPTAAVARLAERLELDPAVLEGYGQRAHTRSDHLERKVTVRSAAGAAAGIFRLRHACGLYAQRAAPAQY